MRQTKKFIYLISPNKILFKNFYKNLEKKNKLIKIAKKIKKISNKYKVKFIINDDPYLAVKINSDGCHIGQNDFNIKKARKILNNKILGVTCHNSTKLVRRAVKEGADYVALGSFFTTKTKKVKFVADFKTLSPEKALNKLK